MTKETIVKLLRRASAEIRLEGLFREEKLAAGALLEQLERHAELLADVVTQENESEEVLQFRVVRK